MVNNSYSKISFPFTKSVLLEPPAYFTAGLGIPGIFEEKENKCGPSLLEALSDVWSTRNAPSAFLAVLKSKRFHVEAGNLFYPELSTCLSSDLPRFAYQPCMVISHDCLFIIPSRQFMQPQNPFRPHFCSWLPLLRGALLAFPPGSPQLPAHCALPAPPPLSHRYSGLNGCIHFNPIASLPF